MELAVGPELELGDRQYNQTWFGISAAQAQRSGLPEFDVGAGVHDVGLHAVLTYRYGEHVSLRAFANVKELIGDVAGSPLVERRTQGVAGIGFTYHF